MALEPFSDVYPDRFFNAGVAEQNMVGMATGLAEAGFIPFVYSIVTFASLRAYEFVRNGPVHHQLPVRIAGIGGGFEYGPAGPSHHGLEDVGVMRIQPGMTVVAPADYHQARSALLRTWDLPGPVYYRLGKDDKTVVPGLDGRFEVGRAQTIRGGEDALIVSMGSIAAEGAAAADLLAAAGIRCGMMVVASVSPPPLDDLASALAKVPLVLTVEAHYVTGGIGSLVAEVIAERGLRCRLFRTGVDADATGVSGSLEFLNRVHGLDREALVETVRSELVGKAV
ncbi:MAG: transketolase family protein [Chloroflexota bacterium]